MKSKKHKVKIPEGFEVESVETYNLCYMGNPRKETTVKFKPIKKQLPKTWEEYKHNDRQILETEPFEILMTSKNIESFRALARLVQLRDHYNDGWEPDWKSDHVKPSIEVWRNEVRMTNALYGNELLSFKTPALRSEFLSNFRELIETAKPLL